VNTADGRLDVVDKRKITVPGRNRILVVPQPIHNSFIASDILVLTFR
jgi:hypothetical protein